MKLLLSSLLILCIAVGCSASVTKVKPHGLTGGMLEPTYPPYCWVQPKGEELWYPCGQKSDEELGKHGH